MCASARAWLIVRGNKSMGKEFGMRMAWEEIVREYPNMYVAFTDAYPGLHNIESAVVLHSEKDMSAYDILVGALEGKWNATGTGTVLGSIYHL